MVPGGTYTPTGPFVPGGPRPDELHMPAPNNLIPSPAVPETAPPGNAVLPLPTLPGTPVKSGSNK